MPQILSEAEITTAASLLAKLEPGYLPQALFNEFTRLSVTATVVLVVLHKGADEPEVLLVQREPNDPIWPSYWHLPGSVLRPNDHEGDYRDAFKRIITSELGGINVQTDPLLIRTAFTQTKRGREITRVYTTTTKEAPKNGALFRINELPQVMIDHELSYIQSAISKTEPKLRQPSI
jgi:hypothetical protein